MEENNIFQSEETMQLIEQQAGETDNPKLLLLVQTLREVREVKQLLELSDEDIYCTAKIFQSVIFANELFYGCSYCKHQNSCFSDNNVAKRFDIIRKTLQDITGVDLSPKYDCNNLEVKFNDYQS